MDSLKHNGRCMGRIATAMKTSEVWGDYTEKQG